MTLEAKTLFVALLVGLAHLISGIAVFVAPEALGATPLAALHHLTIYIGYGGGFAGATLILAGLMAVVGGSLNAVPKITHGVLFMPQQILLVLQMWTITVALIEGKYPDGYTPLGGAWFILADQTWAWALAASHSVFLAMFIYGSRKGGNSGINKDAL